jgi:predicted protein tyrosine phosphatase
MSTTLPPVRKIEFLSEARAKKLAPMADSALISISDWKDVELVDGWNHLLRLQFMDADVDEAWMILFDDDMAQKTLDFVATLPPTVTRLYVHCWAGISRSAAMAKFFSELFKLPFNENYTQYNRLVYRKLYNNAESLLRAQGLVADSLLISNPPINLSQ